MIMQEQIENTYKLNAVPSTTWTWLKMNNDIVSIDANFVFVQGAVAEVPKGFAKSNFFNLF